MAGKDEGKSLIEIRLEQEEQNAEKVRQEVYEEAPAGPDTPPVNPDDAPPDDEPPAPQDADDALAEQEEEARKKAEEEARKKDKDTFEQKYLTLKGKYDKELPKALADVKAAKAEVTQWQTYAQKLEGRIEELTKKLAEKEIVPSAPGDDKPQLDLTDPAIETLVHDYPGMKKVLEAFAAQRKADAETIRKLKAQVESSGNRFEKIEHEVSSTKEGRFEADMVAMVGRDWRVTDADPKFFEWLGEEVPYTGKTRLQLLQAASAALDAATVSKFFNDYRATLKDDAPPADDTLPADDTPPDDTAPPANADGKLKKQIAPPRSGAPPKKGSDRQPGTYTRAQYVQFQDEVMRNRFNPKNWGGKTEAEMDAIFNLAIIEHRLI